MEGGKQAWLEKRGRSCRWTGLGWACLIRLSSYVYTYLHLTTQTNPANWKSKDAAIHLMLAVTVRAESAAKGASQLNEKVDVMSFFTSHVRTRIYIDLAWQGRICTHTYLHT